MDSEATGVRRGKLGRFRLIGGLGVVLLLVLGVVAVVVVGDWNRDAPVAAVRDYVEAIARGDGAAAQALVDPTTFAEGVDPALAGAALASAKVRIVVGEVSLEYYSDVAEDVVEVTVEYSLASSNKTVVLRAQRTDTGLVDSWRVLDPLLVPVRVETNEAGFDTGMLGGAAVPVGGHRLQGFPERRFFVYPGVYELRGPESRYLRAEPVTIIANRLVHGERPANTTANLTDAAIIYRPTPELTTTATTRLAEHVTACFAPQPKVPAGCPEDAYTYADNNVRLLKQPTLQSITSYQVDYQADGSTEPSLRLRAQNGRLSYTGYDGDERRESFWAYAHIVVTPAGELTITFTTEL